jgi:hypothetical protein
MPSRQREIGKETKQIKQDLNYRLSLFCTIAESSFTGTLGKMWRTSTSSRVEFCSLYLRHSRLSRLSAADAHRQAVWRPGRIFLLHCLMGGSRRAVAAMSTSSTDGATRFPTPSKIRLPIVPPQALVPATQQRLLLERLWVSRLVGDSGGANQKNRIAVESWIQLKSSNHYSIYAQRNSSLRDETL